MNLLRLVSLVLACCAVLGLSACDPTRQGIDMNTTVAASLPPMRTHCIGRLLIDLPDHFEMTPLSEVELIYGLDENWRKVKVTVPRVNETQPTLQALTAKLVAELTSRYEADTPTKNMLASARTADSETELIRAHRESLSSFDVYVFHQIASAVGLFRSASYKKDKPQDIEAKLLSIAQSTRYFPDPDKVGKGACLGPLLIDAGQDGEWFHITFLSDKMPGVYVSINTNSLREKAEDEGLIGRTTRRTAEFLTPIGMKFDFIRKGKVAIGGRPGEEQGYKYVENDVQHFNFMAEILQDKSATFEEPVISIELTMGGRRPSGGEYFGSPMNERDALALWDAIVKSIRPRPGAV